jgi:hypothetical protein
VAEGKRGRKSRPPAGAPGEQLDHWRQTAHAAVAGTVSTGGRGRVKLKGCSVYYERATIAERQAVSAPHFAPPRIVTDFSCNERFETFFTARGHWNISARFMTKGFQ